MMMMNHLKMMKRMENKKENEKDGMEKDENKMMHLKCK